MKKLTVFETTIIGFFIGVIAAAYNVFTASTGGFMGVLLKWISLEPILTKIQVPQSYELIASFIFFVLVYTIYGLIIGVIVKNIARSRAVMALIVLVLLATGVEQITGKAPVAIDTSYTVAAVAQPLPKAPRQYFGNEVIGDLNGDAQADVAFLIRRNDAERGTLYYLATALTDDKGRTGTNLLFIGEKIVPQNISIDASGMIEVLYTSGQSTTTESFKAQVVKGNLEKI